MKKNKIEDIEDLKIFNKMNKKDLLQNLKYLELHLEIVNENLEILL